MKRTHLAPLALLAAAMSLGAAACGDDGPDESTDTTTDTTDATDTAGGDTTDADTTDADTTDADTTDADTSDATDTTDAAATTEAGGDTTEASGGTAEAAQAGDEPTIETATPVLVGLPEDEAAEAAEALEWELRVTRIDGEDQPATMDLRPNRVNVAVVDGEVTEVLGIG